MTKTTDTAEYINLGKRQTTNWIADAKAIIEKMFADAKAEGATEEQLAAARKRADALTDDFLARADEQALIRAICE